MIENIIKAKTKKKLELSEPKNYKSACFVKFLHENTKFIWMVQDNLNKPLNISIKSLYPKRFFKMLICKV